MRNALLYARVSHDDQVKFGMSIDTQIDSLTRFCENNSLKIKGIYKDEGISGGSITKRLAFQRMIDDSNKGDIILFTKLDRFSRNLLDANIIVDELDKKGVSIKAIDEDDIDTVTADGKFIFNLKLSLAQREREKTSERIKSVFEYKASRGEVLSGRVPLGYKIQNKRLVIDDETKDQVLFIFNMFDSTGSIRGTTLAFNEKYNNEYGITTVKNLLQNEKYIGKHRGNDLFCEPLIDKEMFDRIGKKIKSNVRKSASKDLIYLFSNMIYCPKCGHKMYPCAAKDYIYYRCPQHTKYHRCSFAKVFWEHKIEKQLLDKISIFADEKYHEVKVTNTNNNVNKSKLTKLKNRLDRTKELYIDGDISKEDYLKRKDEISEEIKKLEEIINKVASTKSIEILNMNVKEIYDQLTKENKSKFWHRFILRIYIDSNGEITDIEFA